MCGNALGQDRQFKLYDFDKYTGNLLSRKDSVLHLTETFSYDNLDRLTHVNTRFGGVTTRDTISYSNSGNILHKTGVGDYDYAGTAPHAVTSVSNPLDTISSLTQDIKYTPFQKVASIREGNRLIEFSYGVDKERIMSRLYAVDTSSNQTLLRTIVYVGDYEKEVVGGTTIHRHYIEGGDGLAAIYVSGDSTEINLMSYIHGDHLGSYDLITNDVGTVVQRSLFDPWGGQRLYEGHSSL